MRRALLSAAIVAVLLSAVAPSVTRAQAVPRDAAICARNDLPIPPDRAALDGCSADEVRGAIEQIGLEGTSGGVAPLAARIRKGLPNDLLLLAIDTLTVLGVPEAGDVLYALLAHRREAVRERTVRAVTACRPRGAERALLSALGDSSVDVRRAAAEGLTDVGTPQSIGPLFTALDRGVLEATAALARLGSPTHVTRLLAQVGRLPFTDLTSALRTILAREDMPVRSKLEVIGKLQELATPEVKAFLREFVAGMPRRPGVDAVRQAAEEAILRIVD